MKVRKDFIENVRKQLSAQEAELIDKIRKEALKSAKMFQKRFKLCNAKR